MRVFGDVDSGIEFSSYKSNNSQLFIIKFFVVVVVVGGLGGVCGEVECDCGRQR